MNENTRMANVPTTITNEQLSDQLNEIRSLVVATGKSVLTVKDLSLLTGLSKSTIYKLTSLRQIPHYKSEGGKITYFKRDEIEKWMCATKIPTNDEVKADAVAFALSHSLREGGQQ